MKATSQVDGRWNFWRQLKLPLVTVCLVYQTLDGSKPFQIGKLKKKKRKKKCNTMHMTLDLCTKSSQVLKTQMTKHCLVISISLNRKLLMEFLVVKLDLYFRIIIKEKVLFTCLSSLQEMTALVPNICVWLCMCFVCSRPSYAVCVCLSWWLSRT